MLSLHKLEIFAKVISHGSFSAAAEQLYMSQPAVSKHIQDLEHTLGTRLFERAGARGVKPTRAGHDLYDYTCQILKLVAEAENKITNVDNIPAGQIAVGVTQGVGSYLLPEWLSTFGARFPNLTVSLQTGITSNIVHGVLNEDYHMGFVEGELDTVGDMRLSNINLGEIEMVVVVGKNHPWWEYTNISIKDLHQQPYIARQPHSRTRIWSDGVFIRQGIQPRIIAEFDSSESIKSSSMSGLGVTILPEYTIQREVEMGLLHPISIHDVPLRRQLKLVWNNQIPFNPVARAFLKTLTERYAQLNTVL